MNKILELSKKIYEAGFEPDMQMNTWCAEPGDYVIFPYENNWHISRKKYIKPYFTESRLWEMLPKNILSGKFYHLALLELVVWCIENGYIKSEVKE